MVLQDLPGNVMLAILLHLDYKSIHKMKVVSKSWLGLISHNPSFWKQKFEFDFGTIETDNVDYQGEYKLEYGLRVGEPKVTDLKGHKGLVHFVRILGPLMLSGSIDKSVRVWDITKMECVNSFEVKATISAIIFEGDKVFVGLDNGEIQEWSLASGQCHHKWQACSSWIWYLGLSENHLVSVDSNFSVKSWDASTYERRQTFDVDSNNNVSVYTYGKEVFCGKSNLVHVVHQDHGLVCTLAASADVRDVCGDARYIYGGLMNGDIQVWDKETKRCVTTLKGLDTMWYITCDARKVLGHALDGQVKIWETKDFQCIRTINIDKSFGEFLGIGRGKVVFGSQLGVIRVFDFAYQYP